MSKNYLLPSNIIVSLDPCLLSPIFWCFRTEFCDILLSKLRELPTGAFLQSRNSGESIPCKWSKRTGRILAEYYLRIQYIRPLGSVTTLAGILFKMASQQMATIATSCSICPHEILAFTTSTFPSFYSSYILAHFQVLTIKSHARQSTTLCADECSYMSNTSSLLSSLPVIFVLDRWGGRCFCLGISEGWCINPFQEVEGPQLFSQKNSKTCLWDKHIFDF